METCFTDIPQWEENFRETATSMIVKSWEKLFSEMAKLDKQDSRVKCFIAFDEAHAVTLSSNDGKRTSFSNLGTVLSWLTRYPLFVLFMSTNNSVSLLAPPQHKQESLRAASGSTLFPPMTLFPTDIFADELGSRKGFKLADSCNLDVMTRFGRPM